MARIKRGTTANKRRKNILQHAKGFRWGRKSKFRLAKQAVYKAWSYAYRDRRTKKRDKRRLWQMQINAACRMNDISYSKFIGLLKKNNINLNRKVLSILGHERPEVFTKIVEEIKK